MLSCTGGSETGRWGPGRALARQHRWCTYDLTALPLLQWQVVQRLAHMYDELSSYGSASQQYEALMQQYNVRGRCPRRVHRKADEENIGLTALLFFIHLQLL